MDFELVAIALGDILWISLAFLFGFIAKTIKLPPMVGFLLTGFVLSFFGNVSGEMLQKLSDLGITLLLFTVGLKLNLQTLSRPQVWGVTSLHTLLVIVILSGVIYLFALIGVSLFSSLLPYQVLLLAFALSFSSTVFVVKILEDSGETKSLHGRIAIGILIMQDILAVIFLAFSTGKTPSLWSALLLLLIPLRPLLIYFLKRVGHGELLILYGLILSLGGAEIFELFGVKGDLGALALGALVGSDSRSGELASKMLGLKDLFLLGFFLSIGLSGQVSPESLMVAAIIAPFILVKSLLFYLLMVLFRLRARTSLLATANLTNYSEFGLIVIAISVANGWLDSDWLVVTALAISISFVFAAIFNSQAHQLYGKYRELWHKLQTSKRLAEDRVLDTGEATIAIIGMGRVGTGAYDTLREKYGDTVIGVDFDPHKVRSQKAEGRNILLGDPSDTDFWDRITKTHNLKMMLLALPKLSMTLSVITELKKTNFDGPVAASVRYEDEIEALREAGATTVFNIYTEAGVGFADHVEAELS